MNKPELLISFLGVAISLFSAFLGAFVAYRTIKKEVRQQQREDTDRLIDSAKKEYAAQRDFEHLRRNQEQLKEAIKLIQSELDEMQSNQKEIKGIFTVLLAKSGDSISGILGHIPQKKD